MTIERGRASTAAGGDRADAEQVRAATAGRWLLIVVAVLFLAVVTPVVLAGAPLVDDYHTCLRPVEDGAYGPFLADSWRELGVVRPARFLEIGAIAGLCQRIPFGFVILISARSPYTSSTGTGPHRTPPATTLDEISSSDGPATTGRVRAHRFQGPT